MAIDISTSLEGKRHVTPRIIGVPGNLAVDDVEPAVTAVGSQGKPVVLIQDDDLPSPWLQLKPADLRSAPRSDAGRLARELVARALANDSRAVRKIAELFRSMFISKVLEIRSVADVWWHRGELPDDFLTFLLTGVRPNLREKTMTNSADGTPIYNSGSPAPLKVWLGGDGGSLWSFVSAALSNVCVDLVRRGRVQSRRGYTGDPDSVERRTDNDVAAIPSPRFVSAEPVAERSMLAADEVRLYRLALGSLSSREQEVLAGIGEGLTQVEIAQRLGVGVSRVSQLRSAAIEKLRSAISNLELKTRENGE